MPCGLALGAGDRQLQGQREECRTRGVEVPKGAIADLSVAATPTARLLRNETSYFVCITSCAPKLSGVS